MRIFLTKEILSTKRKLHKIDALSLGKQENTVFQKNLLYILLSKMYESVPLHNI